MQTLLDTHVFLRALTDDAALKGEAESCLAMSATRTPSAPYLPEIHADPFDRLLMAQALTEPMKLLTHDAVIARYHPDILLI